MITSQDFSTHVTREALKHGLLAVRRGTAGFDISFQCRTGFLIQSRRVESRITSDEDGQTMTHTLRVGTVGSREYAIQGIEMMAALKSLARTTDGEVQVRMP